MMYLGTHNPAKAKSMAAILQTVAGDIVVSDIFTFRIGPPLETGISEIERAKSKSTYYFQRLNAPVISSDDGFYFSQPTPFDPLSVSDVDTKGIAANVFWRDLFTKHNVTGGVLRKAYSVCTADTNKSASVDISFSVGTNSQSKKETESNILNQIIVPSGFSVSIADMTEAQLLEFRIKYLVTPIKKLLQEVGIITT